MADQFDYSALLTKADDLIEKFGQSIAIRRETTSGPDFDPTITTTDHDAIGVQLEYTLREQESSLVELTDRKWLVRVQGLGITPGSADKLVVDGTAYEIKNVKPLNPGGTVLLYELQVAG